MRLDWFEVLPGGRLFSIHICHSEKELMVMGSFSPHKLTLGKSMETKFLNEFPSFGAYDILLDEVIIKQFSLS